MIKRTTTAAEEVSEKANEMRDRAVESIAGGLAQLKHIRAHLKDGLGSGAQTVMDRHIEAVQKTVEELSILDLSLTVDPNTPGV